MKRIGIVLTLAALLSASCQAQEVAQTSESGFAVVELFTSEGCSSCPPAEVHLNDWVKRAEHHQLNVYPLAFHVDYWDRLGWKDRFSSSEYSDRQRVYRDKFENSYSYTPQLVINGQHEFSGLNRKNAAYHVQQGLNRTEAVGLTLGASWTNGQDAVQLDCQVRGAEEEVLVNFAIVEQGLATSVKRGENSGRSLEHENVVRAFSTAKTAGDQLEEVLELPEDVNRDQVVVIAYVQDPDSWEVLGATKVALPKVAQ